MTTENLDLRADESGAIVLPDGSILRKRRLEDFVQNPANPVKHSPRNLDVVVNSIQKVGAMRSGAASKGKLLAGNLTWEAMAEAGIEEVWEITTNGHSWVVVNRNDLTEEQEMYAAAADQRAAELSQWDAEVLSWLAENEPEIIDGLWTDQELKFTILEAQRQSEEKEEEPDLSDPAPQIDRAEELKEFWGVESGQLWRLGDHRLICGDCTDPAVVDRLLAGGAQPQILFTSPPYWAQRDYTIGEFDWDKLMLGMSQQAIRVVAASGAILVNLGLVHKEKRVIRYWDKWLAWMDQTNWPLFDWYVWDKINGLMGDWRGRLAPAHEWIFHFANSPRPANKTEDTKYAEEGITHYKADKVGLRKKDGSIDPFTQAGQPVNLLKVSDSVIRCQPARGGVDGHPAPFSVEFAAKMIMPFTNKGEVVFEPFNGSGTTIIACEALGRSARSIDVDPGYCAVAIQRWADLTQRKPELMVDEQHPS